MYSCRLRISSDLLALQFNTRPFRVCSLFQSNVKVQFLANLANISNSVAMFLFTAHMFGIATFTTRKSNLDSSLYLAVQIRPGHPGCFYYNKLVFAYSLVLQFFEILLKTF